MVGEDWFLSMNVTADIHINTKLIKGPTALQYLNTPRCNLSLIQSSDAVAISQSSNLPSNYETRYSGTALPISQANTAHFARLATVAFKPSRQLRPSIPILNLRSGPGSMVYTFASAAELKNWCFFFASLRIDRFDLEHLVHHWPESFRLISEYPGGSYFAPWLSMVDQSSLKLWRLFLSKNLSMFIAWNTPFYV